jgi:hypothetical protein
MRARTAAAWVVGLALSLPAAASAAVVLTVPPLGPLLPGPVEAALRPFAAQVFALTERLDPASLAGQLFYGSFAPLPALVGGAALALHAALLGAPWGLAAWLVARRLARPAHAWTERSRA